MIKLNENTDYEISVRCPKCKKEHYKQTWNLTSDEILNNEENVIKRNGELYVYRHMHHLCKDKNFVYRW